MTFLASSLLWGSLAASIPIALHFFYRSRHRNVPWAAMKFLLAAIEQTSRRLKFQELILLCLRVLLLLILALALARPSVSTTGQGPRGDAVDAVLIVDQSMSMSARSGVASAFGNDAYQTALRAYADKDNSVTCFDRARAAAKAVLANLPPNSTVQVIACTDRAALLGPADPAHRDRAGTLLDELKLTALGTDYDEAFRLAAEALDRGPSPNKEIYLFSDLQRRGFESRAASLEERVKELVGKASMSLVQCAPSEIGNAAVAGITPQTTLRTGERADFAVVVRNTGKKTLRDLSVELMIDGKSDEADKQAIVELDPGQSRAVALSVLLDKGGRHVLTASVGPDDLAGDNRYDQVIHVNDRVGILVVDGAPNSVDPKRAGSYFLQHALNPVVPNSGLGVPVTIVGADQVTSGDFGGKELCVLVNVSLDGARDRDKELVRSLATFVQSGKALMVFVGDKVAPAKYNELLFDQARLLPYRMADVKGAGAKGAKVLAKETEKAWLFDRTTAADPPYGRFKGEQGYIGLDRIEIRRFVRFDEKGDQPPELVEESRVLLRYTDGSPAIASRKRPGHGEVLFFTTSIYEEKWSDLYISPPFVPLVQISVNHLLEGRPQAVNRVAGESLVATVPMTDADSLFDLLSPNGKRERLGLPVTTKGRATMTAPETALSGLYRVIAAGREPDHNTPLFAVVPDLRETEDLEALSKADIAKRYGTKINVVKAGDDGEPFSGAERLKREWTMWVLLLLLFLVLCEMALAWHCGRAW